MLKIGQKLVCETSREEVTVIKELGSGGQGTVYLARGKRGKEKALKWYSDEALGTDRAREERRAALEKIMGKSPDGEDGSSFAWPLEFVRDGKNFGYVMELVDFNKYIKITDMKTGRKNFQPNQRVKTLISLNIASAFAKLHAMGFCYRDINEGNILFSVKTGEIKIIDNDNVGVEGASKSAVLGIPDYMAPEILRRKALPSKYTDYHSLAVFLFMLWTWHHPFEGRKALAVRCWDRDAKVKIFGEEPLFIFDEANKANALPHLDGGDNFSYVHTFWKACPDRLKELFRAAFTAGAKNPGSRVIETRWIKEFALMYDTIAECPRDGAENFWNEGVEKVVCWRCRHPFDSPARLKIVNKGNNTRVSTLVLKPDARLFARHLAPERYARETGETLGTVVKHPQNPQIWGLRNDTKGDWTFKNTDGREIAVPKGKSVPVAAGNEIDFGGGRVGVFDTIS